MAALITYPKLRIGCFSHNMFLSCESKQGPVYLGAVQPPTYKASFDVMTKLACFAIPNCFYYLLSGILFLNRASLFIVPNYVVVEQAPYVIKYVVKA